MLHIRKTEFINLWCSCQEGFFPGKSACFIEFMLTYGQTKGLFIFAKH